jgi:5-methylcytosine-specific restriction endonuclease McrA
MTDCMTTDRPDLNNDLIPSRADDPALIPLEHLEARICELAGHLAAGTCQFLLLVADFDARKGWASWEMPSCAAWLSWKCQLAPGTAREQVRVARALRDLPVTCGEFAAGRLSYAKVRALTRIAAPQTERDLVDMATPMTAGQLERFARAHRQVSAGEQDGRRPAVRERTVRWRHDETGISVTIALPPAEGAVVLQALRAWVGDVDHPHDSHDEHDGRPAERAPGDRQRERDAADGIDWDAGIKPWQGERVAGEDLADAIVGICGGYLSGRVQTADNPDLYQVIIHAGTSAIAAEPGPALPRPPGAGVSAETPVVPGSRVSAETPSGQAMAALKESAPLLVFPEGHPAWPWRCHVEDGQVIDPAVLRMIGCDATVSAMLHDAAGNVLNAGRRSRKASAALRRAVRERDHHRCRFPGCQSRRVDLHHIKFWANGGETKLENLICLCKRHHHLVHDKGVIIATTPDGFSFYLRDGKLIPDSPPLPGGSVGGLAASHAADITRRTIIPPHSGERLDLHEAIWVCFARAKVQAAKRLSAPVQVADVGELLEAS